MPAGNLAGVAFEESAVCISLQSRATGLQWRNVVESDAHAPKA